MLHLNRRGLLQAGTSALAVTTSGLTSVVFNPTNASDFNGFINTINSLPNRASFYASYDTNRDGVISQAELGASLIYNMVEAWRRRGSILVYSRETAVETTEL